MIVTEQDAGRTVTVRPGEPVELRLGESPTTGYRWAVVASGQATVTRGGLAPGGAPGGAAVRTFQVVAAVRGPHTIVLQEQREWDSAAPVGGTFRFTLLVP